MNFPDRNSQLILIGIVYRLKTKKFIECHVDADFVGGWDQSDDDNAGNAITQDTHFHQQYLNAVLYILI